MFFFPITRKARARYAVGRSLYAACVAQTRQPIFYTTLCVPDTFDGRFELTALHAGLVVSQLTERGGDDAKLAQALFDEMFVALEQTCRQIGVGDLSVPRHLKRMMKALKGRAMTYTEAIQNGTLNDALARNLYGTTTCPHDSVLSAMSNYIVAFENGLTSQNLAAGELSFPQVNINGVSNGQSSQAA